MTAVTMESLSPEILAFVEAKLQAEREATRIQVIAEQEEQRKRLMNLSEIMAERGGAAQDTVKRVLTGANVEPVQKIGNSAYYDRKQVTLAFVAKDENILNFYGLLHQVKESIA